MDQVKPIRISNFEGGLSTKDATIIDDNQLSEAVNVFYNQDKKLQTRYGQTSFGSPIPDATILIEATASASSPNTWAVADDGAGLAINSSTQKRGAGAVQFDVDVSASADNFATVTCAIATPIDISTVKGSFRFFFKVPTGALTNLTNLTVRVGSDSSNYYEWIQTDFVEGQQYIILDYADATETGTADDAAIDYLFFRLNYAAGYADKDNWEICSIYSMSSTYTLPQMSVTYFENSDVTTGFARYLHMNCGTALWEFDETSTHWSPIKTGLTAGTRFSSTAYKNIMYFTNGVDNYFDYTGAVCTERTGANTYKGKYLLLANDIGYIAGDPTVPSSLGYTGGVPSNLQTFPNVLVCDEDSSDGVITGLINLGPIVFVMKEGKIYKVNTATPSREQIDYSEGFLSHRALVRVENEIFGLNESGVYTLSQREATIGSVRADALSDDIKQIIDAIEDKKVVSALYSEKLKNCYFFCDTAGDGVPDTALVFSILTKKWTTYNNMPFNQAVLWKDVDGLEHIVCASAINGQAKEIETGTNDNGNEIIAVTTTKDFDFDIPETYKTFEMVEFFGFIALDSTIRLNILVDGVDATGEIEVSADNYVTTTPAISLSVSPLATYPLSGLSGTSEEIPFYSFKLRIPMYSTGSRIKLKTTVNDLDSQFILTKASIYPYAQPIDIYPTNLIA
jgi:hypothetical protein